MSNSLPVSNLEDEENGEEMEEIVEAPPLESRIISRTDFERIFNQKIAFETLERDIRVGNIRFFFWFHWVVQLALSFLYLLVAAFAFQVASDSGGLGGFQRFRLITPAFGWIVVIVNILVSNYDIYKFFGKFYEALNIIWDIVLAVVWFCIIIADSIEGNNSPIYAHHGIFVALLILIIIAIILHGLTIYLVIRIDREEREASIAQHDLEPDVIDYLRMFYVRFLEKAPTSFFSVPRPGLVGYAAVNKKRDAPNERSEHIASDEEELIVPQENDSTLSYRPRVNPLNNT